MYETKPSTSASVEAGVGDRVPDRDAGELELALARAPAFVVSRLADARDHGPFLHAQPPAEPIARYAMPPKRGSTSVAKRSIERISFACGMSPL